MENNKKVFGTTSDLTKKYWYNGEILFVEEIHDFPIENYSKALTKEEIVNKYKQALKSNRRKRKNRNGKR